MWCGKTANLWRKTKKRKEGEERPVDGETEEKRGGKRSGKMGGLANRSQDVIPKPLSKSLVVTNKEQVLQRIWNISAHLYQHFLAIYLCTKIQIFLMNKCPRICVQNLSLSSCRNVLVKKNRCVEINMQQPLAAIIPDGSFEEKMN